NKAPVLGHDAHTYLDTFAKPLIGSGGYISKLYLYSNNEIIHGMGSMMAGLWAANHILDAWDTLQGEFFFDRCLQVKLRHVVQCLRSLEMIGKVLYDHPIITLSSDVTLYGLVQKLKTTEGSLQELFELLESDTFKGEPSFFVNYGVLFRTYCLLHEHIKDLEPLLCVLGEIDVYMSTARLYNEHKDKRVQYTFAQYKVGSYEPAISLKDLWNPFIDVSSVVSNSIELGRSRGARNLIITGPNEGGKSTFVKSLAFSLILAQSICIVPARKAVITPFSYIATYLNITDNHGKSLFEAQVDRIKQILNHIDAMNKHSYSFVVVDELFNGTQAHIGQAASYSVADYLSKKPDVISVFPTHFQQLTLLEGNGCSVNYKLSVLVDENGDLSYPFKVEKGFSAENTVLAILRNEGFHSTIVDQTAKLIK
ncbi:hypothetical protein H0X06_01415, partial [Candidatus Dependentiae bacterium]|nr:hypothetical protein [Candidatus Dependentiae bacterium]